MRKRECNVYPGTHFRTTNHGPPIGCQIEVFSLKASLALGAGNICPEHYRKIWHAKCLSWRGFVPVSIVDRCIIKLGADVTQMSEYQRYTIRLNAQTGRWKIHWRDRKHYVDFTRETGVEEWIADKIPRIRSSLFRRAI
ncbi:MAG: hypothetical protein ACYDC3_03595 [Candidatus Binataceae bacterium]